MPSGTPFHQMVWIDNETARLFGVTRQNLAELAVIRAPNQGRGNVHHKAGTPGPGHVEPSPTFLALVTTALKDAREVLIVGPANTKHALKNYIAQNAPLLDRRVIGVEPMDKCSQGDLQAFASLFFHHADQMRTSQA
jgi:stalled ribosome rescue protein Dom34